MTGDDPGAERKLVYKRQIRRRKRDSEVGREMAEKIAKWLDKNLPEVADAVRKKFT